MAQQLMAQQYKAGLEVIHMFDFSFLVFIGFVAAVIGLLVGIGLYRNVGGAENKVRELNQALADAEAKNKQYQQHVADHFSQTALMLNDLTEKFCFNTMSNATNPPMLCPQRDRSLRS